MSTLTGKAREAAGLAANSFDFVIMNPPFNAAQDRATPDGLKRQAHVMEDGLFEGWLRSAAAVVRSTRRPGDHRAARSRSADPRRAGRPLRQRRDRSGPRPRGHAGDPHRRAGAAGLARRHSSLLPPLVLHETAGDGFSARADAINNGKASLFGD